jgi:hypothetical protein
MLRLLSDEDVHDDIIRGLRRRDATSGEAMPGLVALLENIGAGRVIDDILLVAQCAAPEEIRDQVLFIPF